MLPGTASRARRKNVIRSSQSLPAKMKLGYLPQAKMGSKVFGRRRNLSAEYSRITIVRRKPPFVHLMADVLCSALATKSTSNKSPPWAAINEQPNTYVETEYLPNSFLLKEPSRMQGQQLDDLLKHWRSREAKDLPPLRFKAIQRGGQVAGVDKDSDSEDEPEEPDFDKLISMSGEEENEDDTTRSKGLCVKRLS